MKLLHNKMSEAGCEGKNGNCSTQSRDPRRNVPEDRERDRHILQKVYRYD